MKDKLDNIYIYIWEEFNTIYIGRTVNPKGRHYAHKHRESERTYQFSSEHHVEHPKMIIIENDLTLEEGVEREKYWINYYREDGRYEILNKTNGGEIGGQLSTLTEEEKKEKKKKYNSLHKEERSLYYKKYYKEHIDIKDVEKRKILKAEKRVRKQILRAEDKIRKLIYKKSYYERNKEIRKSYQKQYSETHKEERKKYLIENREEILLKKREYYKKYRKAHKNEINQRLKKYRSQSKT